MTPPALRSILVLTTHFPYGTWNEAFFETEFKTLSQAYDTVYVLPLKPGVLVREIPTNVIVLEPVQTGRKLLKLRHLFYASTLRDLSSEIANYINNGIPFKFRHLRLLLVATLWRSEFRKHTGLNRFLASESNPLVYSYWGHMSAQAIEMAKLKYKALTCVRYHSVDLYLNHDHNLGYIPYRSGLLRAADLNVFISEQGKDYFESCYSGQIAGKTIVNRLGSPDFGPISERPYRRDQITMVSVSSIGGVKRVHLIAGLAKELAKWTDVVWHHFGSGSSPDLDVELESDIPASLEINMHGDTPRTEILNFYRSNSIDFFVNLSTFEGIPVSIMEAMNAGIPVVASDVGGTKEIVKDGISGMLVHRDSCLDTESLARVIIAELGENGTIRNSTPRKVWNESYNAQLNAEEMLGNLNRLRNHV